MVLAWLAQTISASAGAPVFLLQPTNQTVGWSIGGRANFAVVASNALAYKWYFENTPIAGATGTNYTVSPVGYPNAGPYYVVATNASGSTTSSLAYLNVTNPPGTTLAAPWVSANIGAAGLIGSGYTPSNELFTTGAGISLTGTGPDSFHYVYQTLVSTGAVAIKFSSQTGTNLNQSAGIMMRETTATGSRFILAGRGVGGQTFATVRSSTGGSTVTTTNAPSYPLPNYWLQLTRAGTNFAAQISTNGLGWLTFDSAGISMSTNATVGVYVMSGNSNMLSLAVFTNVTVVP